VDIFYVHTDHLNTPRAVTRPSDNLVMWTWYSDPFGTDAANENPAGAGTFAYNLRLPGQVFDGQAGLHDNGFRAYDPATGRYVESDPIGLYGGSYSTYSYTNDDPVMWSDPYGLTPWDWDGIGDTNECSYYDSLANATKCSYYKNAALTCRGKNAFVNIMLRAGITQAWINKTTTKS
jgi:RHS repeat-associated protein